MGYLDHSQYSGVVMATAGPGVTRRSLYADDIGGINAVYSAYSNEGIVSSVTQAQVGTSFTLSLSYPRAANQAFNIYMSASGMNGFPLRNLTPTDSRILGINGDFFPTENYPENFINFEGTLNAQGQATATVNLPVDPSFFGQDLYFSDVTLDGQYLNGYEDVGVGVHVHVIAPTSCNSDSDCDDGDLCTDDICDAGSCSNPAYDCDDGDVCTVDSCSEGLCINAPLACNDGNACTADSCQAGIGCVGVPISCDDGDACTSDSCNPATGCVHVGMICNDGNACTTDSCQPTLGCVYRPISGCSPCRPRDAQCNSSADCCSGKCRSNKTCG